MIRFNYRQSVFEQLFGDAPLTMLAGQLRLPLAAIGAALLVVAATWTLEARRVAGLDADLVAVQARVEATAADGARAERLTAAVTRLREIRATVAAARRDLLVTTNTIAEIGNVLPPQTWLTAMAATPADSWTIDGRSARVDEIGTMLRRVQELDRHGAARLVSIAATGRSGRILDFVISWNRS